MRTTILDLPTLPPSGNNRLNAWLRGLFMAVLLVNTAMLVIYSPQPMLPVLVLAGLLFGLAPLVISIGFCALIALLPIQKNTYLERWIRLSHWGLLLFQVAIHLALFPPYEGLLPTL